MSEHQTNEERMADVENNFIGGVIHIMRGLPGSGKTKFIREKIKAGEWKEEDTVICSADDYMVNEKKEYEFKPVKLTNAHIKCRLKYIKALFYTTNDPTHIVVDNTNIELEHIAEYILLAKSTARVLQIHEIAPVDANEVDPKTGKPRLLNNKELAIRASEHGVSEHQIKAMRHKFKPLDPAYIDHLIECDDLDPLQSFQSSAIKSYRFDPDEKAVGISGRVQALMHNPHSVEHAEREFRALKEKGTTDLNLLPITSIISEYKTVHDCAHAWKEMAVAQLESRLTNPEDVALHTKLTALYKYLFIQTNLTEEYEDLLKKFNAVNEVELAV